jgi:2-oxoglutarate dehydrogenase E1 component
MRNNTNSTLLTLAGSALSDLPTQDQVASKEIPPALVPLGRAEAEALVRAYRLNGYRRAQLDPLLLREVETIGELDPNNGAFANESGNYSYSKGIGTDDVPVELEQLLLDLENTYCGPIGVDCTHVRDASRRSWLWRRMESDMSAASRPEGQRRETLNRLIQAETWEHYLAHAHGHRKRFSLEGCESLLPLLDTLVQQAGLHKVEEIVLGMPHRGRLNVLVNVLGMPADQLTSLIKGAPHAAPDAWDLIYHLGHSCISETEHGAVKLFLAHNPSHLESVSPVVSGMARALQDARRDSYGKRVVPIQLHGDASFTGQGVVMETLNLSQTRGYGVGGTVHVIVNNQIGFTSSDPRDARSSQYCTDIVRMVDAPVIHVNADHPDYVVLAAKIALAYRMAFGADIVIDLVGYRRQGHNEHDPASLTQPLMQRKISAHPTVVTLYSNDLARTGFDPSDADTIRAAYLNRLPAVASGAESPPKRTPAVASVSVAHETPMWDAPVGTSVPAQQLSALVDRMIQLPHNFHLHPQVETMIGDWKISVSDNSRAVDWRLAENLAYASLLSNGYGVRISGMDASRGTFLQRQAIWHDQSRSRPDEGMYVPLRHIDPEQGRFDVFDSPLSEEAVLGFEYGYSVKSPRQLVVWEAQYGDFVNGAQVMIDQYVSTGEAKWGYASSLVVLLPHGYEGVGPEHSSAFLGRFLQLCAQGNMRVVIPSTAAQLFHLLRRQALVHEYKPLIVMTPKSWLYDHAPSHSPMSAFSGSEFKPVIGDSTDLDRAKVERVVIASGKIYHELDAERARRTLSLPALLRIEQLYPFPRITLAQELAKYPALREVIWIQEEAKNHGAWHFVRDDIEAVLPARANLVYAGRPAAAPAAVCRAAEHLAEQRALIDSALGGSQQTRNSVDTGDLGHEENRGGDGKGKKIRRW